jgi:biopolymer transport protein ExbD
MLSLHQLRWSFTAGRATVYLAILSVLAAGNPVSGGFVTSPRSTTARPFRLHARDLCVTVKVDGSIFLGRNWYYDREIPEKLAWLRVHNRTSRFILRADRHAQIARVRTIVSAARGAGFQYVTLELQPVSPLLARRLAAGTDLGTDTTRLVEPEQESNFLIIALH